MPLTPLHLGPSATLAFPLRKYLDIPVFVLASFVIDLEPLIIILSGLPFQLHGFPHTLIGGVMFGSIWGYVAYLFRKKLKVLMKMVRIDHKPKLKVMVYSGILGFWFHVFLDSFMHADIQPFYPFDFNPLYRIVSVSQLYTISALLFIPAFIFYIKDALKYDRKVK